MEFSDWEPVYEDILEEMGYSRTQDEASARLLRHLVVNKHLIDPDALRPLMKGTVNVIGAAASARDIECLEGTMVCAGSAASTFAATSVKPDILVTDLDGDIDSQLECCRRGAVAFIHAHGDNSGLLQDHVPSFQCPMVPTTQSRPDLVLVNMGGFTDGDRAVCMARHLGARSIRLVGFDFDHPVPGVDDPAVKGRKLAWAKRIIFDMNPGHVTIIHAATRKD